LRGADGPGPALVLADVMFGLLLLESARVEAVPVAAEGGNGRQGNAGNVMILGGVAELSTGVSVIVTSRVWLGHTSSCRTRRS